QLERLERTHDLLRLGDRRGGIAAVDEQRAHATAARRQDLVREDPRRQLAVDRPEAADPALVALLPPARRGDDLRLARMARPDRAGMVDAIALAQQPPADHVEHLD